MSDFGDIRGQEAVKRAILIALAGGHSVALIGPAGWGKSMLIDAAITIIPSFEGREYEPDEIKADSVKSRQAREANIHVEVPPVPFRELCGKRRGTDSACIRDALGRATKFTALELSDDSILLLKQANDEIGLNARAYHNVVRIARTIANLEGEKSIQVMHIAEAVQYQLLNRRS